jgi:vitamin B12/bleomycin/antimicrobial peptide transport system ATP-binding/permease protein
MVIRQFLKECWGLARPFWQSEERVKARILLAVIIALNLGEVYINVLLNKWNVDFYNSLQTVDKAAFIDALLRFSYLAFSFIIIAVYKIYLNQMLRLKWRRWMTNEWLSKWLDRQHYYRMQLVEVATDNPDQRISEDIEQFIMLSLGLTLGLMNALVTLCSFLMILWSLSGTLEFSLLGLPIAIPGYMLWAALVYAVVGTWLTTRIGHPLIRLNFNQQRYEADFRFGMVRLRENSESIAFYGGEVNEQMGLMDRFTSVVDNFWKIMKRQKMLTWFVASYHQIAIIFPFIVASPRFFAGHIKLGELMQTVSAFNHVQGALSYIIDAYTSIATWKAVVERLTGFGESLKQSEILAATPEGLIRNADGNAIATEHLNIHLPNGQLLLKDIELHVKPGDSLLITGPSGIGKSTLLRCLAGLWPFMEGRLELPAQERMMFVPQKPYLPLGSLREVLCYPAQTQWNDDVLRDILETCRLGHLAGRLDEVALWSHMLSLGEQQRVAFARILLIKPDFLFLDEATSALDEKTQNMLYSLIKERLVQTALVSVGHRDSLRTFHVVEKKL